MFFRTAHRLCAGSGFWEQTQSSGNTLPMLFEENGNIRHFRHKSAPVDKQLIIDHASTRYVLFVAFTNFRKMALAFFITNITIILVFSQQILGKFLRMTASTISEQVEHNNNNNNNNNHLTVLCLGLPG